VNSLREKIQKIFTDNSDSGNIRSLVFGKNGLINNAIEDAKQIKEDAEKKIIMREISEIRAHFLRIFEDKFANKNTLDSTIPTVSFFGKVHLITHTMELLRSIVTSLGFVEEHGPSIEDDEHNFDALNVHEMHPARGMHDTFYIGENLLRTHTSGVEIRVLKAKKYQPPFAIFSMGRVFRRDEDSTHSPMFNQMECFFLSKDANFANLKYFVKQLLELFFEVKDVPLRFRPSYFPFTEPSMEVDILSYKKNGKIYFGKSDIHEQKWLEVLGSGMIRRNILDRYGYEGFTSFAMGVGIERLAMLKYGFTNINDLYQNNLPFLDKFAIDLNEYGGNLN
jgi:phenylalanyl-tRNA synthetase alpha chain